MNKQHNTTTDEGGNGCLSLGHSVIIIKGLIEQEAFSQERPSENISIRSCLHLL
jgi:hypothetical protein